MPLPQSAPGTDVTCRLCPDLRPALRAIRSAFVLDGPVRALVHALKYRGWYSLAEPLGTRMASLDWPREVTEEVRLVVPVPLAPGRARERGYNQAALLAREFARARGWVCVEHALERARSSGSQTTLHPGERRANVAGAFRARTEQASRLASEHVIVVDDVWTTGATALACGEAILDAGARAYSVLSFARALPELERREKRAALAGIL
jgi:ComF family protein